MSAIEPKEFQLKTGEKIIVRSAVPEDAERLLAFTKTVLGESNFYATEPDEVDKMLEQEEELLKDYRDAPGKIQLLVEINGVLIGRLNFLNGKRRRLSHHGEFGMSVKKEWRGKGAGSALLQALLDWAAENPLIEKVCLGVFPTNERGLVLYKKFGFTEEGRRVKEVKMPDGTYEDTILMYRFVK